MENFDMLLDPIKVSLTHIGDFLPRLVLAIVVLIGGWLVAKLIRLICVRALRAINFNVLTERTGMDDFLRQGGLESDMTDVVGILIYWMVILAALVIAFNSLGVTQMSGLISQLVQFIPRVIIAIAIVAFGSYFARFIGNAVTTYFKNTGILDAVLLGRLAQAAVFIFVILMALEQIAIGGEIIRESFLIILAGLVLALAIAFGIGGQNWARSMLERWWPQQDRDRKER